MVVSRSDSKRRKKGDVNSLQESPKRAKVHAQRKFAQGSHLNSPVLTPVKDKDKAKFNGTTQTTELLPVKRPKTEEFVNFLCFRGSDLLPKALEFFNEPSVFEPKSNDTRQDSSGTSKGASRSTEKHSDQGNCVAKAEVKNKSKPKAVAAVQALKKKYQEQRLAKEKKTLTKLALKVKEKNVMRTRSAGPLEEAPVSSIGKKPISAKNSRVEKSKIVAARKPVLRKQTTPIKRLIPKTITRGGLRSGGELPLGSDVGLKTERKTRKITKFKPTSSGKKLKKAMIASSLSDFSSDDEQPLLKRPKSASVALAQRITTRSRLTAKTTISKSQRPTRRTKEAATIFMEMLGKDLRSPDEEDDTVDSMSVESFIELPNSKQTERREKEFKDLAEKNKLDEKKKLKSAKKENLPLPKKKEEDKKKLPTKSSVVLNSIKSRTLRRNSHRLRSKENELKRLQAGRKSRLLNRSLSKTTTKEEQFQDEKMEASSSIALPSVKKREKRSLSGNITKKSEIKVKNQKVIDVENISQSVKTVKQSKDAGTVFNDSDEEPLGHKINQVTQLPNLKCARKIKSSSDKEETLSKKNSEISNQKHNKRKEPNSSLEVLKDNVQASNKKQNPKEVKSSISSIISKKQSPDIKKIAKPKPEISRSESIKGNTQDLGAKPTSSKKVTSKTKLHLDKELAEDSNNKCHKKKTPKSKCDINEDTSNTVLDKKKSSQPSKRVLKINEDEEATNDKKSIKLQSNTECKQDVLELDQTNTKPQNLGHSEDEIKDNTLVINSCSIVFHGDVEKQISQESPSNKNEKVSFVSDKHIVSENKSEIVNLLDHNVSNKFDSTRSDNAHYDTVAKKENKNLSSRKMCDDQCSTDFKGSIAKIKPYEDSTSFVSSQVKVESIHVSKSSEIAKIEDLNYKQANTQPKTKLNLDKEHSGNLGTNFLSCDSKSNELSFDKNNKLNSDCKSISSVKTHNINKDNITLLTVHKEKHITEDKMILSDSIAPNKSESFKGINLPRTEIESYNSSRTEFNKPEPELSDVQTDNIIHIPDNHLLRNQKNVGKQSNNILNPLNKKDLTLGNASAEREKTEIQICSQIQRSDLLPQVAHSPIGCNVKDISTVNNTNFEQFTVQNQEEKKVLNETGFVESGELIDSFMNVELKNDKGNVMEIQCQQSVQQLKEDKQLLNIIGVTSGKSELKHIDPKLSLVNVSDQRKCPLNQQSLGNTKPKEAVFYQTKEASELINNSIKYKVEATDFEHKSFCKEERFISCNTKLDNLDLSDKISSAVDSLMSLKNVQKLDDKSHSPVGNRPKSINNVEIEKKQKYVQSYDAKHFLENESKHTESNEYLKVQIQDLDRYVAVQEPDIKQGWIQDPDFKRSAVREPDNKRVATQEFDKKRIPYMSHELDLKRVTIQEPDIKRGILQESDIKRVTIQEPDFKRSLTQEIDTKRVQIQDLKPKPSQVLKGCPNPKSMLKPGTLIDIAGISHSPEIMTPLRPGSDGEIISMSKPVFNELSLAHKSTAKAYEPRSEPNFFGYNRWQPLSPEKNNLKTDQVIEKETLDSKSRLPVNESAWRQAFKNVREPKSNNNSPVEKPAVRKQLSVNALAKRHCKSKSEVSAPTPLRPAIPFLRQNKQPFLGSVSPNKSKQSPADTKKSTDIDLNSLREKEAEVEEFLRQFVSGSMSRTSTPVAAVQGGRIDQVSEQNISCDIATSNYNRITNFNLADAKKCQSNTQLDQGYEIAANKQPSIPMKQQTFKQSAPEQNDSSLFVDNSTKRSSSPINKLSNEGSADATARSARANISDVSSSSQDTTKSNIRSDSIKQEQTLNIFQESARRSSSPKSQNQKPSEQVQDGSSNKLSQVAFQFCISSSKNISREDPYKINTTASSQQINTNDNIFKHTQHGKRVNSPTRAIAFTNTSSESVFKDCGTTKRTKSPTLPNAFSQRMSPICSPQRSSPKRNSNSPVPFTSTANIFKDSMPVRRSYSPTSSSTFQSDSDSISNVFSQNVGFKRSISPLCNKPDFLLANSVPKSENTDIKISNATNLKRIESYSEDSSKRTPYCQPKTIKNESLIHVDVPKPIEQNQSLKSESLTLMEIQKTTDQNQSKLLITGLSQVSEKQSIKMSNYVKKEVAEFENPVSVPHKQEKVDVTSDIRKNIDDQANNSNTDKDDDKLSFGTSEAKHRLPLAVEQTLKKLSQVRSSTNKKTLVKTSEQLEVSGSNDNKGTPDILISENIKDDCGSRLTIVPNKLSTGIYSHTQEGELDLMAKKKVNMSSEEIKRWLNDSSSPLVEHKEGCSILENNICECEYGHTVNISEHKVVSQKQDTFIKAGDEQSKALDDVQYDQSGNILKIEKEIKTAGFDKKLPTLETYPLKHSFSNPFSGNDNISTDEINNKTKSTSNKCNVARTGSESSNAKQQKGTLPIEKQGDECVNPTTVVLSPIHLPNQSKCSDNDETEIPTSPLVTKIKSFKLVQKCVDAEQEARLADISEVLLPHLRDDVSSSNDISSSNEETPEKSTHPERRSIFLQRRSALKVKERKELNSPSVKAFSPENESSVYAFEPDLPPASTPFRRSKGKEGRSTNTTTDEDELTPSSNSIAVQVNFDNEAVLECSTQTDVQEGDDDDMHTFYIPLQQNSADTTKAPLIQGVAVKLDTEGPDQKVIMRAKLVTKPLSTFSRTSATPARALIGSRSGKPEQKVRPLSVKPPVGTVQPTARPKPSPQAEPATPSTSKTCSPQAARLAKRCKAKGESSSTSSVDSHSTKAPPPSKVPPANLVEAPTFYPTEKEFEDPLEYIDSITAQAEKYGLCRVVPPSNFKPECKVSDDMRFTAYNQYIHKMLHRWGPNVKEMLAIKKYLATQSIALTHPPWIGGMEVDLPRLYQTVQQCGGLKEVIEKKRWHRVADAMKIPKSAQDRVTKLDDIYCKFLLPYDTLSHAERNQLFEEVEKDWIEREKRVDSSQNDDDDESDSDSDIDECIVKGRSMALNAFYRIARNTMSMWFSKTDNPSAADVELEFWRHVASRQNHVCVHSGSIDSGAMGYGFPTGKNSSTSRHPWNLKVLTNNPGSILRFLSPVIGVTVPTLHVGMLFSACCWYRDPHGLPWIEYLHTGASKIWYGIPDSSSEQFRSAVMDLVPRLSTDKKIWLASDTAMVPPPLLVERGVSLSRIVQEPGQFIIVFPKAFTSSICTGYVVSESVYFAQPSWLTTAQTLFNDMRESSEPTVFSLEKLLFSIVNDSRSSVEVLNQILPIVVSLRDGEIAGRRQLEELGLNSSECLNTNKRRKNRPTNEEEEDYECDECRTNLFISFVSNSHDSSVYCLPHAVELLTHRRSQVKHCCLLYAFSEDELEDLVEKLKSRVENKNQKRVQTKSIKS